MNTYNAQAVDQSIASHNRSHRGAPIGRREASMIHALLKGHTPRSCERTTHG